MLDFRGTDLVVLSACETGLGDLSTGEGVHGLRRAFLMAGARTVVTSLYRVPDGQTKEVMTDFYRALASGKSKIEALSEAQNSARTRRQSTHGAAHPFYWGSFVLVGDPE